MRNDIIYYYETDVPTLYNGFLAALSRPPFERECKQEPFHTLTFGLNFSFKYNMNGGACYVRFIPWKTGAAVDLHFTVVQLAGGRTKAYARDVVKNVNEILNINGVLTDDISPDLFMDERYRVLPSNFSTPVPDPAAFQSVIPPQPEPIPMPVTSQESVPEYVPPAPAYTPPAEAPASKRRFCPNCGMPVDDEGDLFCTNCGIRF